MALQLVDYIALDFKAPRYKHAATTASNTWTQFAKSLQLLLKQEIQFEVRTTWHSELLNYVDLGAMVSFLADQGYRGKYYLQRYVNGVPTLKALPYSRHELDTASLSTEHIEVVMR